MELKTLSEARGVSGQETAVRDYLRGQLDGQIDELDADTLGNLFARKRGRLEGPVVMFAAHMDEVGFLVTGIDKEGMLHVGAVGGIDAGVIPSKTVRVGPQAIPGVIGTKAIHLQEPDERTKPFDRRRLVVDIGAKNKEDAAKLVKPGDQVTFATGFAEFGAGLWKGKALDDRIGCAVLLEVLRGAYEVPVVGVFTVQEEIGTRGAAVAAYAVRPDVGVCLEGTVCADIPGTEEDAETTRLDDGPAISVMDAGTIHSPQLVRHLVKLASEHGIPYQYRRSTRGGNDASRMSLAGSGAKACAVSVPCRYIHSPVAVASRKDFENTVQLLRVFLESVGKGELEL